MKFKSLVYFGIAVCVYSCVSATAKKTEQQGVHDLLCSQQTSLINKMQGVWAKNPRENALFFVKGDSLWYVENQEMPMRIAFTENRLTVYGDVVFECEIIKLDADSLCYIDNITNEIMRLVKIK